MVTGYETSEKSVRRYRGKLSPGDYEAAEHEAVARAPVEDVGTGADLDEPEAVVDGSWDGFGPKDKAALHGKLDAALDAVSVSPDDVVGLRVSTYQSLTKDADGDAHIHDLYAVKLQVRTKELAPAWPVVQPAPPATIVRSIRPGGTLARADKVTVVLPDTQIGYRFFIDDQTFDPFHDEAAMDVALQVVAEVKPDRVIFLGDFLDLPAFGRYEQEQAFAATTQKSVDRGHRYLASIRAVAPDAEIDVLEGNHDRRLQNMIVNNAKAAFGLRQAMDVSGWPVLSVPFLCNFADLEVNYAEGYPAGQLWINNNLRVIHGTKVRSNASTAAAVVHDDDVSTIFGHIHRVETQYLTRSNRSGGRTLVAHTPGCLCRIDGAVPSVKGSTDLLGRAVESFENWQQGLSVIHYEEGDGGFAIESLFIDTFRGHKIRYNGKIYTPGGN